MKIITYNVNGLRAAVSKGLRFNSRAKNKGWRIDYCMVSESVRPMLKSARILNEAVHSDHCPMLLELETDAL